jgi:hypothetical protein
MDGYFFVWFDSADLALLRVAETPRVWASVVALCLLLRKPMRVFDDASGRPVCDLIP